ncbi:hypothetical protein C8R43DRAFT_942410 [Mycena crocata]|nr:hypothetical protein C8R43DRAFT_942410 [Mycena crocata]
MAESDGTLHRIGIAAVDSNELPASYRYERRYCRLDVHQVFREDFTVHYLKTEDEANFVLAQIVDGVVGFDTQYMRRTPTLEEGIVNDMIDRIVGARTFSVELRCILTSNQIVKNDLRTELRNLVDTGMMAQLLLAKKYSDSGYQNLGMSVCAEEILRCRINQGLQVSNWTGELTEAQIRYAATDAIIETVRGVGVATADEVLGVVSSYTGGL